MDKKGALDVIKEFSGAISSKLLHNARHRGQFVRSDGSPILVERLRTR